MTLLLSQNARTAATARNALYFDALAADEAHAYNKTTRDVFYAKTKEGNQVDSPSETRYLMLSGNHSTNNQIRHLGSSLLLRHVAWNGGATATPNLNGSHSNVLRADTLAASRFKTSGEQAIKNCEALAVAAEATGLLDAVEAKNFTRNDTGGQRHRSIAQDLEAARTTVRDLRSSPRAC